MTAIFESAEGEMVKRCVTLEGRGHSRDAVNCCRNESKIVSKHLGHSSVT